MRQKKLKTRTLKRLRKVKFCFVINNWMSGAGCLECYNYGIECLYKYHPNRDSCRRDNIRSFKWIRISRWPSNMPKRLSL